MEVSPTALVLCAERVPQAHRKQALPAEQQVGGKFKNCFPKSRDSVAFLSSYSSYNANPRPSTYRHIQGGGRVSGYNSNNNNQGFSSQYSTFSSHGQRVPQLKQQLAAPVPKKTQPRFRQRPPVRDEMRKCILLKMTKVLDAFWHWTFDCM